MSLNHSYPMTMVEIPAPLDDNLDHIDHFLDNLLEYL